ncbi:MAG TPA: bifunctional DNA-formamidopyrimidine glycosylase/DNA-(apurinic or apyrimidinic site) lyase [Verrucomicrobiae bacterium]|nr:bifunctional DNA-formamidopyrimidine glycosylase/DNA-(apurinic or apyrimidinic site) lyase [Verrucomicrobiae bacterium]
MPELPEVEVLVRQLRPLLLEKFISGVEVRRLRIIRPTAVAKFKRALMRATIGSLNRRGKYLLFELKTRGSNSKRLLVGHLGMTGRMYLLPTHLPLPKHAAVVLRLGSEQFVFEDVRYFGRLTLETDALKRLGPEPLGPEFTVEEFRRGLARSAQPIKVKLLDQSLVAGIGNIYASEALFRARLSPRTAARKLTARQVKLVWRAIRETLSEAIEFGSTVPLDFAGLSGADQIFYYGSIPGQSSYEERLRVYDREGEACVRCRSRIRRIVQGARSTFYCPNCQRPG